MFQVFSYTVHPGGFAWLLKDGWLCTLGTWLARDAPESCLVGVEVPQLSNASGGQMVRSQGVCPVHVYKSSFLISDRVDQVFQ